MKRLLLSVALVLGISARAWALDPLVKHQLHYGLYQGHTYSAPAINGYYLPPVLGGYNVYTPAYNYGYGYPSYGYGYTPAYGFGAGSYNAYGGFNSYGAYGGFSGTGWGWGGAF